MSPTNTPINAEALTERNVWGDLIRFRAETFVAFTEDPTATVIIHLVLDIVAAHGQHGLSIVLGSRRPNVLGNAVEQKHRSDSVTFYRALFFDGHVILRVFAIASPKLMPTPLLDKPVA